MERLGLSVNGADNALFAGDRASASCSRRCRLYSASPSNRNLAENARRRGAPGRAHAEQTARSAIQSFRADIDSEIATAVGELNDLLAQFKDANTDIVSGTRNGRDVSDSLDQRDATAEEDRRASCRSRPSRAATTTWSS